MNVNYLIRDLDPVDLDVVVNDGVAFLQGSDSRRSKSSASRGRQV